MSIQIQSKKLFDDYRSLPTYFQDVLTKHENDWGIAETTANFIASWWQFPGYNELLNLKRKQHLHLIDRNCLFDYTDKKVAGVSGIYPTINSRKIAFQVYRKTFVIKDKFDTAYFEVFGNNPYILVEHFNNFDSQPPRTWDVYSEIIPAYENDDPLFCLKGVLSKPPPIAEDWELLPQSYV